MSTSDDREKKTNDGFGSSLIKWVFPIAAAVWLLGFVPAMLCSLEDAARFGDSFGLVNALFSALALAGVIIALFYQHRELRLQREELQLQREELQESQASWHATAEAQRDSSIALRDQGRTALLAAYLQALRSMLEAPDEMEPRRRRALGMISQMINRLQRELADDNDGIAAQTDDEIAAAELERLSAEFSQRWEVLYRMNEGPSRAASEQADLIARDFAGRIRTNVTGLIHVPSPINDAIKDLEISRYSHVDFDHTKVRVTGSLQAAARELRDRAARARKDASSSSCPLSG